MKVMKSNIDSRIFYSLMCFLSIFLLSGCGNSTLFNPKGLVGLEQRSLFFFSVGLMCIVVIPPIFMAIFFMLRYKDTNKKSQGKYNPDFVHSNWIELFVWGIPCIIILILGTVTWRTSHSLDPAKAIQAEKQTIEIQVVSLDWKWLFIYPNENVASVNEIAIPVNAPVHFKLTSETIMSSFFIPQLGSQLYAMAGMNNNLNLIANEIGEFKGWATSLAGEGYSDMKFTVKSVSDEDYAKWISESKSKAAGKTLDKQSYVELAKPTIANSVEFFSPIEPNLYVWIMEKFGGPHTHHAKKPAISQVEAESHSAY